MDDTRERLLAWCWQFRELYGKKALDEYVEHFLSMRLSVPGLFAKPNDIPSLNGFCMHRGEQTEEA